MKRSEAIVSGCCQWGGGRYDKDVVGKVGDEEVCGATCLPGQAWCGPHYVQAWGGRDPAAVAAKIEQGRPRAFVLKARA